MRTRPTTRAALSIAGGLAALLTLTACGGDSTADATVQASTAEGAPSAAPDITAYRDCMAENGVTLPDMGAPPTAMPSAMPSGGPGAFSGGLPDGVDQEAFDAAQAACADLAPAFGPGGAGGPGGSGTIDATALAAFRSCLSDNGVTVAEGQDPMRDLDRSDPDVKAAMDTCAPLLPVPTPAEGG
jgi:hypothetical protein